MNEGFIRPKTPQHLGLAYQMASHVIEWIEETHGFDALVRMLHGYRDGRSTDDIFRTVLRAEPDVVDAQFDRWLRARANPDQAREYMTLLREGARQFEANDFAAARRSLESAAEFFPAGGGGSPYALLARIHIREGDDAAAIEALARYTEYDENAYSANLELARLRESAGDMAGAAAAFNRAVWIFPYEIEPHRRLAELSASLGDADTAVRERRAIVGLRPTDMADARYQLATALFAAGDTAGARTEVLRALEIAPGFEQAQQLLLRLHEPI